MEEKNVKTTFKISFITIVANIILAILKILAGILVGSFALVSDAVHSFSDVFSTIIVLIGVKISSKDPDEKHVYGHERFESIAAILLAILLFATGIGMGYKAITTAIAGNYVKVDQFFVLIGIIVAVVSIISKEIMYRYTAKVAKDITSEALKADAWHHRSDALSSIGSLVAVIGVFYNFTILDLIVGIFISCIIFKVSITIFMESIKKIIDESCPKEIEDKMKDIILKRDTKVGIDSLKTRRFGNGFYADIEIGLEQNLSFIEAHEIATQIHDDLEREFTNLKHCTVHANPKKI